MKLGYLNSYDSHVCGFEWNRINFEALYLPNHEDFALGQHIKIVELCKENNFAIGIMPWCHEMF
jgi:hypothetical protein